MTPEFIRLSAKAKREKIVKKSAHKRQKLENEIEKLLKETSADLEKVYIWERVELDKIKKKKKYRKQRK